MSAKLELKYPRIVDYLEQHESLLHRIVTSLSFEGMLKPHKFGNGITFLMPDKGLTNQLVKLYNDDDLMTLEKIFKSLIITFVIPKITDFELKKDDLSNKLGESLQVKESKKDSIILSNGSVITPEKDFRPGRMDIALYKISGGTIPLEGLPTKHKYDKLIKPKMPIKGGCEVKNLDAFAHEIELRYFNAAKIAKSKGESKMKENPYLEAVTSFLEFLKHSDDSTCQLEYKALMSFIDTSPEINFYLIFEPYNTKNRIISTNTLSKFVKIAYASVSRFKELYNSDITVENRSAVVEAIDQVRNHLLTTTSKVSLPQEICQVYNKLQTDNCIGSHDNVYTSDVFNCIKDRKFWQDTLRFYLSRSVESFWTTPNVPDLNDFMQTIYYCVYQRFPGNNYAEEKICSDTQVKELSDDIFYTLFRDFVRSDYFLYIPLTESEMNKIEDKPYGSPDKNSQIRNALRSYKRLDNYEESESKQLINKYVKTAIQMQVKDKDKYEQIISLLA